MSLFSMFFQNQQSQLGALFLDVLVNEQISLPSKVTAYPIETGAGEITDHITAQQEELTIAGAISASSSSISLQGAASALQGGSFGVEFGPQCYTKLINAIDQLRTMQRNRQMVTVITGLGKYEQMAFTTLTIDRTNQAQTGGQWLQINATLRKIKQVSLKQADLPADQSTGTASGKTGQTSKPSSQTSGGDGVPGSVLYQPQSLRGPQQDI